MIRRPPRSTLFPSPPLFRSRVPRKQPAMTEDTTMLAATRYRAAERLPPIVRAVLDARDEAAVGFGARGDVLYVKPAAPATLPPATITPSIDSGPVPAVVGAPGRGR